MPRPLAWLGRFAALRRRRPGFSGPDPRAEELRRKLQESRAIVEEREEFEAAETPVDKADHGPQDPEARRRAVHEAGRAAAERMRAK
jgi:hypothetical protein